MTPDQSTIARLQQNALEELVAEPLAALAPGIPAPDFTLHARPDQLLSLCRFQGRRTVPALYPAGKANACTANLGANALDIRSLLFFSI